MKSIIDNISLVIMDGIPVDLAYDVMAKEIRRSSDFAWAWHCKIATTIRANFSLTHVDYDYASQHQECNRLAAAVMQTMYGVDMWPRITIELGYIEHDVDHFNAMNNKNAQHISIGHGHQVYQRGAPMPVYGNVAYGNVAYGNGNGVYIGNTATNSGGP